MRSVVVAAVCLAGCSNSTAERECRGAALFGRPDQMTGLGAEQCGPSCDCGGKRWDAPAYSAKDADALLAWTHEAPFPQLEADPYAAPAAAVDEDAVCGFVDLGAQRYRLQTYASAGEAEAAGAAVSHHGVCGLCSTMADLAVYMRYPDLTTPVRQCGLDHWGGTPEEHRACLEALGFTVPCAQIWYFNTVHTRDRCMAPCLAALGDYYHQPDGALNECLQCDEDESGPVFKAVAGRTRRNTGIASALCRPCAEVEPVEHGYALGVR